MFIFPYWYWAFVFVLDLVSKLTCLFFLLSNEMCHTDSEWVRTMLQSERDIISYMYVMYTRYDMTVFLFYFFYHLHEWIVKLWWKHLFSPRLRPHRVCCNEAIHDVRMGYVWLTDWLTDDCKMKKKRDGIQQFNKREMYIIHTYNMCYFV